MTITPSDLYRAASAAFSPGCSGTLFVLDTSDDTFALAAGAYELYNDSTSILAWLRLDAVAAVPADKAALAAGLFYLPPGASAPLILESDATLHGITASSTATLCIAKKVV